MTHKIGSETTGRYFLEVEDDFLDWYFIYGPSFKRILDIYTDLTGKPPVPPKWSFGLWMSRSTYEDRKELMEVCERLREEGLVEKNGSCLRGWRITEKGLETLRKID